MYSVADEQVRDRREIDRGNDFSKKQCYADYNYCIIDNKVEENKKKTLRI